MRKRINKVLNKFGLTLEKIKKLDLERIPIMENVFNTDFDKKILMSYFKTPFADKWNYNHTNRLECYTAAEIFKELGYNVDVVNFWEDSDDIDFFAYEAVYGLGLQIPKALSAKKSIAEMPKVIIYATGCARPFVNREGGRKLKDFYERTGRMMMTSSRDSEFSVPLLVLANRGIVLGNDATLGTYLAEGVELPLVNLDAFYYDVYDIDLEKKDFAMARKHILWFGSSGLLHKGLDLALEVIKQRPDITLHIAGASSNEKEFFEYYEDELSDRVPNIINHGFLKLDSKEFRTVMHTCSAVLFPSVSEGGSPAVLNLIANGGLVPIVSSSAGIDVENFGVMIERINLSAVSDALDRFLALSVAEIKKFAQNGKDTVRKRYTYDNYKSNLKKHIIEAMTD